MRTLIKVGFSMLLLAMVLIGAAYSALRAKGIHGPANAASHAMASEVRAIGKGIDSIELSGPIDMTLRQGATPSLLVRAEQRLLGNIETVQEGNTLHIDTKGMLLLRSKLLKSNRLQVELVLPALNHLNIHGSGDSTVNGFSGEHMEVQLHGSGNVIFNGRFRDIAAAVHGSGDMELNGGSSDKVAVELVGSGQMTVVGSCKEFKAKQTGSGDLDAQHLTAESVAVNLHGSGSSNVQANKSAAVTLRGSGDVTVYGHPSERNVNRTGSGEINWKQ